jgi:uncharacterized Zn finger protein (UPF0148 family)
MVEKTQKSLTEYLQPETEQELYQKYLETIRADEIQQANGSYHCSKPLLAQLRLKDGCCPDCNVPLVKTADNRLVCPVCAVELSQEETWLTDLLDPVTTVTAKMDSETSERINHNADERTKAYYQKLGTAEADGCGKHLNRAELQLLRVLKRKHKK